MTATLTLPDDLADNECRQFDLPGESHSAFVIRHRGQVYAYRNACPHLGIALNWLPDQFMDPDRCFIQCANHNALFTVDDGHCITGPCAGDTLTPLPVARRDGKLVIDIA
ncbi:Rieske (2Fe-2S) protein [Marinobacter halodurans]|uniref:Rieske (2Fe-2S) protein n=1 Tax=Marinobacter halodurans TaxID=2528979 RepID=A0ABY1ZJG1_9GAMM|nr:Rieske 2Fe-2S domain-containing protein [Marinobacter halodurans]TBW49674.1 Rieske (2Fe-2S) protein [Marinobacter halodurans]